MKTPLRSLVLSLLAGSAAVSLRALEWQTSHLERRPPAGAEVVRVEYRFRNSTPKPVRITGLTTSCGCTEASVDDTLVRPGASGSVKVLFTVGKRTGRQLKSIYVHTDEMPGLTELELVVELPSEGAWQ